MRFLSPVTFILSGLIFLFSTQPSARADEDSALATLRPPHGSSLAFTNFEQAAQAYNRLQAESLIMRQNVENTRKAAEAEGRRQAETFALQLERLRSDLEAQRKERDSVLQSIHSANNRSLICGAALVALVIAVVMIMSFFQLRATAKLTSLAVATAREQRLLPGGSSPLELESTVPAAESERLFQSLDKLERRMRDFESASTQNGRGHARPEAAHSITISSGGPANGTSPESSLPHSSSDSHAASSPSLLDGVLGKGEALLQLGNADEALQAFNEALRLDVKSVDAWVKKGSALEKLDRMEEALGCYDRAIELNRTSTLAYLYKGGVCNRLERFDEALACYEQALRTQGTLEPQAAR